MLWDGIPLKWRCISCHRTHKSKWNHTSPSVCPLFIFKSIKSWFLSKLCLVCLLTRISWPQGEVKKMERELASFAFPLSFFTTTDRYRIRTAADGKDTWTPPLGAGSHPDPFPTEEQDLGFGRCWFSFKPLYTRLANPVGDRGLMKPSDQK